MPCHISSHAHDWPRSGTLSIYKCESKCGFCTSAKDYKPASALRKHVLTHVRNDAMALTLEKSTGGRPRLQTTPTVPTSPNQPELPPSGSGLTVATTPVLGNSDAEGEMIETNEDVFRSIKEIFTLENDAAYLRGLMAIPDVMVVLAYSGFLLAIEKGEMVREGLICLRKCLVDCREFDRSLSTPAGNRDDGWGRPWARSYPWYRAFVLALHATKDSLHLPRDPARIMDVFCATMILAMMRRIMDDSESNRRVFWPKVTKDGSSAIGSISFFYLPMMSIFEQWHNNSFALYFEVNHMYSKEHLSCYRKSLGIAECHDRIMSAMKLSPAYGSNDTLVEEVKGLIDRVELS